MGLNMKDRRWEYLVPVEDSRGEPSPEVVPVDWAAIDVFFQRGAFYAAAPWRGIQTTPSPVRALPLVGWKKCPRRKSRRRRPTHLAWVSPRRAGGMVKVRFSCGHQNGPRFRQSIRLKRETPPPSLRNQRSRKPPQRHHEWLREKSVPAIRGLLKQPLVFATIQTMLNLQN
jgi:hypothetical protein